ncbi:MAG: hypothetical protein Q8R20_01000, partial [Nanoarchaeota archaeon]|nr:hypothetical protein [Nanoarchaeota archaeon]
DLHALSTPPAFVLDQDQILKKTPKSHLGMTKKLFYYLLIGLFTKFSKTSQAEKNTHFRALCIV